MYVATCKSVFYCRVLSMCQLVSIALWKNYKIIQTSLKVWHQVIRYWMLFSLQQKDTGCYSRKSHNVTACQIRTRANEERKLVLKFQVLYFTDLVTQIFGHLGSANDEISNNMSRLLSITNTFQKSFSLTRDSYASSKYRKLLILFHFSF